MSLYSISACPVSIEVNKADCLQSDKNELNKRFKKIIKIVQNLLHLDKFKGEKFKNLRKDISKK